MAYILPFLLFGVVAFGISNKGNTHAYIKIAACVALLFAICAFFQLVMHPFDAKESLWSYYQYASDYRKAGGLTGGCLVKILCPFIGVVGAYVVLVVLMVICVILITERSLLAPLGKGSKKAYADMKRRQGEASARRAKNREEKRRQAEEAKTEPNDSSRRSDHKVSGVSFATTLQAQESEVPKETTAKKRKKNSSGKDPDMRELTVSQESDFLEPLPSPFEDFVINRPESTASDASAVDTPLWENEPEPAEEGNMTQEDVPEESVRTRKKTKASAGSCGSRDCSGRTEYQRAGAAAEESVQDSANESSDKREKGRRRLGCPVARHGPETGADPAEFRGSRSCNKCKLRTVCDAV